MSATGDTAEREGGECGGVRKSEGDRDRRHAPRTWRASALILTPWKRLRAGSERASEDGEAEGEGDAAQGEGEEAGTEADLSLPVAMTGSEHWGAGRPGRGGERGC